MCMFWRSLFVLLYFFFGHCVICSSLIYEFWLSLWYLQTCLNINHVHFCDSVVFLNRKWLCVGFFYCLFISVLFLEGEGWDLIYWFNLQSFFFCPRTFTSSYVYGIFCV
jgi:hypothetical protein